MMGLMKQRLLGLSEFVWLGLEQRRLMGLMVGQQLMGR
jgi:hypothetical protein